MKAEFPWVSGEFFREAVDQCGVGIVITDVHGVILYTNQRQLATCGYAAEALIGSHSRVFHSGRTRKETYNHLWQTILSGQIWSGELVNRRANGELYRELVRITPLRDHDGRISHFMAIKEESLARARRYAFEPEGRDSLTGLLGRAAFFEELGHALEVAREKAYHCVLVLADLDHFRHFNQTHGAGLGDQVLVETGHRLSDAVRDHDLVARFGSDEFAVLLTGLAADLGGQGDDGAVLDPVHRLHQLLEQAMSLEGCDICLGSSMGVAIYPRDGVEQEDLLRAAELALQEARKEGGKVHTFRPELLPDGAAADLRLELQRALERGELLLHYQPKVSLVSGRVVGLEALVRWRHPVRGMVPPGKFIPQAEENGAIVAVTEWVIREACRQLAAWRDQGLPPVKVAVNLSARDFHNPRLLPLIAEQLHHFAIAPGSLDLELTEGTMMKDPIEAARLVDAMKRMGLTVSLDDFGTGYSSLAYLSRFAIDCLKIDQSFIRDITSNPVNASIANATIAMAHQLGKSVVAEGIETEAQMEYLRRHDCDEGQGYLFSKPVPAEEIPEQLNRVLSGYSAQPEGDAPSLLLVDDEPHILAALRRLFRREGYQVMSARSGKEALELMALHPVQVIVSDQRMPEMSGVELLSRVKTLYPDTVRIILSGYSDISTVTEAINRGAIFKYFTKPWDDQELKREIRAAVRGIMAAG